MTTYQKLTEAVNVIGQYILWTDINSPKLAAMDMDIEKCSQYNAVRFDNLLLFEKIDYGSLDEQAVISGLDCLFGIKLAACDGIAFLTQVFLHFIFPQITIYKIGITVDVDNYVGLHEPFNHGFIVVTFDEKTFYKVDLWDRLNDQKVQQLEMQDSSQVQSQLLTSCWQFKDREREFGNIEEFYSSAAHQMSLDSATFELDNTIFFQLSDEHLTAQINLKQLQAQSAPYSNNSVKTGVPATITSIIMKNLLGATQDETPKDWKDSIRALKEDGWEVSVLKQTFPQETLQIANTLKKHLSGAGGALDDILPDNSSLATTESSKNDTAAVPALKNQKSSAFFQRSDNVDDATTKAHKVSVKPSTTRHSL